MTTTKLIKPALLIAYLAKSYDVYFDRLINLGGLWGVVLYLVLFSVLCVCLFAASNIKNDIVRYLYAFVFFLSSVFIESYSKITNDFLTYDSFISILSVRESIGDVLHQYGEPVISTVLFSLILMLGVALRPVRQFQVLQTVCIVTPIIGILLLTVILFFRGGEGAKGLPAMFTPLSYLNLYLYDTTGHVKKRQAVNLARAREKVPYDIVLIVDESISANYLDINSVNGVNTSLKKKYDAVDIYNYGYAAAITNCSAGVNYTFRHGGSRNNYMEINATKPSVWSYAKNAGLRTVYIDAQRTRGRLQNKMTESERSRIEQFVQFDDVPVRQRDMAIANTLVELFNNDTQEFIMVNKVGAHFPVHDKYPDDFLKYQPALKRGDFLNISDTSSREGFDGDEKAWVLYRNSYKNTLLWNVGAFFTRLFERAKLDNVVMIYTSDHGQDLHERGNPGKNTHCGRNPNIEEGLVPLVVIKSRSYDMLNLPAFLEENKNKSSHYNIFPTLLLFMLYDPDEVNAVYGRSLNMPTEDPFTFNIRFNAPLGIKPIWKYIDLNQIVEPISENHN